MNCCFHSLLHWWSFWREILMFSGHVFYEAPVSSILLTPFQWRERCEVLFSPFFFHGDEMKEGWNGGCALSWKMTCWIVSFSLWPDTTSPLEKSVCECFVCVFVITQIISHAGLVKVEWNLTPIAFLLIISSVLSKHVALWMCGLIPCQCENALIHWGILKPWSASFHSLRSRCGNKREGKWSPVL